MKTKISFSSKIKTVTFVNMVLPLIMLLYICFITSNTSFAGTKTVYTSVMNGNWATSSIWSPAACPAFSDDITISHSVVNFTNLTLSGSLLIESSGTLSSLDMIVSNGAVLLIYGTLNLDNLTINNGSSLCIMPSGVVAISGDFNNKNNTTNVVVSGNLIVGGNFTNGFGGIISGSGAIFVSGIFNGSGTTFNISPTNSIPPNSTIQIELPVELLDFTVVASGNTVNIKWRTASENNNDYFTIEKSDDGISFTELTRVGGAGNSNSIMGYAFSDMDPGKNLTYYRLKQTDFDGQSDYCSQIRAVLGKSESDKISEVVISPNPFTKNFNIRFLSEDQGSYILKIFDTNSKCVFTSSILGNPGMNDCEITNLKSIPQGTYFINIFKKEEKIYSGKILKY